MSGHRLRAPQENRAILAEPPLDKVGSLLAENQERLKHSLPLLGKPLAVLRQEARHAALNASQQYLHDASEPIPDLTGSCLLLAGHQPELFHPGVWVKNFALRGLAQKHGALSLNLMVDNDTAKSTVLHVPGGDHLTSVPFDHWQGEVPFEERKVLDEDLFSTLVERVQPLTRSWPYSPLLSSFWPEVVTQSPRTPLLGERLVRARRNWERKWGCHQLEVPLSLLCQTEPFVWFACHILENMSGFFNIYNEAVRAYRREHGLRSKNHPVPDLIQDGDWLELPFWAWREGQNKRNRLFARLTGQVLRLRMGKEEVSLPRPSQAPEKTVLAWRELAQQGIKIRTRALTTTLFARLLVGDLFMHGIGGGKYDELTDVIMNRFYGLQPPHFLVLSATLLLPLPRFPVTEIDMHHLHRRQRDLWWNPQRYLSLGDGPIEHFQKEKKRWIERPVFTHAERVARFRELRGITQDLRSFTQEEWEKGKQSLNLAEKELAANQVLQRRDFAFCLFPEDYLRDFMKGFLQKA